MSNLKSECSLKDTSNLRKLILENPDLPILIFCGEEAYNEDYAYSLAYASDGDIKELTLYKDFWVDEDDYKEMLADDLADDYKELPDEEFCEMIDEKAAQTEFVKAIVIYVG